MTFRRHTLGIALLFAGLPALSSASPYSQLVIFGDSLSDSGQFPDLGGATQNGLPTDGIRFTNRIGPDYIDGRDEPYAAVASQRLAGRLGLQALPSTPILPEELTGNPDGTNYAVGGSRTDEILASIIDEDGSEVDAGLVSRTRDGYLVDVPRVSASTLFYVNGGGNDILQGRINDQASAASSAADLVAGVAALQRAGARYIIVSDLPNVGLSPAGFVSGQRDAWSGLSGLFNAELDRQLLALGGNVIRLNYRALFIEMLADPARFGFDPNVAQMDVCFNGDRCQPDPTWGQGNASADPDKLIFYDGVHPTAAVQQISADYVYSLLSAPWEIGLLPDMALSGLNTHQQHLRSEWQADRGDWQTRGNWRSFTAATGQRRDFDEHLAVAPGDSETLGVNLGATYRLSERWRLGFALGLQESSLEMDHSQSDYDLRGYLLSTFAQYRQKRLWADVGVTAGHLNYHDLERRFDLGIAERIEKGDTDGQLAAATLRLGYALGRRGSWQVSPFVSADYVRVEIDAYREDGENSTALHYAEQTRDSKRLGVGLEANLQLSRTLQVFGEVAREREYEDDPQTLRMGLNSMPGFDYDLQTITPYQDQTLATLGLGLSLGHTVTVRAAYHLRDAEERQHGASLSLNLSY
ncbi:autotransporter domain-containing SGNH/GDSL hydrolase family protein [Serpens gallinarum]|uniref:Autotransporter domain-containing protein n=1 Tax=Serpens gallinarum TaxID=2763075 RepID=A0ABR8TJ75_9PSED|nr:autotransporter domain-containing SGNH/GDSL hydrolase family protein [Serpens gallinarum]MBD7975832.1 autotransporter domain-containing protein [Serpens gallinarum]